MTRKALIRGADEDRFEGIVMNAHYSATTIANWLLAWSESDEESKVSNLKLQKLLYYAQGTALATIGRPLFDDPIEAWAHGPVVSNVYHHFKHFGSTPLEADESFSWDDVDDDAGALLASVWKTYGGYSAWKLREMTHSEAPWKDSFQADIRSNVIDPGAIQKWFEQLHEGAGRHRNAAAEVAF